MDYFEENLMPERWGLSDHQMDKYKKSYLQFEQYMKRDKIVRHVVACDEHILTDLLYFYGTIHDLYTIALERTVVLYRKDTCYGKVCKRFSR